MQKPYRNDTELLQHGEATTEYNDNASTIYRLNDLKRQANIARTLYNYEGLIIHLSAIKGMELELAGKLKDDEVADLEKVKIREIPMNRSTSNTMTWAWKRKLEEYEHHVRSLLQAKGLGVTAKKESDPRKAILD